MARVLIVEDSPTQQETIRRSVEQMGHVAFCANDGQHAVEQAKLHQPDIILMDIIMPHTNGFQATRALSRDPQTQHIPVIMVTTKSEATDRMWGMKQGAKGYVVKPFEEKELKEIIAKTLQEQ